MSDHPTRSSGKRDATWDRLLRLMQENKPYLNPKLVQRDIADELQISNRTLSRMLSENSGLNFNSFINKFRVWEVCTLLRDQKLNYLSLEALAQMAGFNSRAVFYRCFKSMAKMSPAEYRAISK
ncbi:MAG: helix-turn-helix domain-containing protein [Lewinella sp.]